MSEPMRKPEPPLSSPENHPGVPESVFRHIRGDDDPEAEAQLEAEIDAEWERQERLSKLRQKT